MNAQPVAQAPQEGNRHMQVQFPLLIKKGAAHFLWSVNPMRVTADVLPPGQVPPSKGFILLAKAAAAFANAAEISTGAAFVVSGARAMEYDRVIGGSLLAIGLAQGARQIANASMNNVVDRNLGRWARVVLNAMQGGAGTEPTELQTVQGRDAGAGTSAV